MALYLSTKGVRRIVLWDRNLDGSNETKRKIGSAVEVLVDRVDVSSPRDVIKASKNLKEVDVLINNAGVVTGKYLLDMTDDEIQRTMSTNSLAHFWTTRAFLPYMLRRGDECAVVTVSSLMGQMSGCKLTDYCASKHAANGFHKALRLELRALCKSSVVHTMLVCPYVIDTGMFSGAFEGSGKPWFMRIGLFPKLKSQFVAKTIIQNLESRSHLVVLPWYFRYVPPVLHLFPASLMDWIEEFAGGRIGMNEFRGRQRNVSSS
jgi:all-trans-retinol dehydrogenase (NAD+)